jgi:hypothetical protein
MDIEIYRLKIEKHKRKIEKYQNKINEIEGEFLFIKYYFKEFIFPNFIPDYYNKNKPDISKYIYFK